MSQIHPAAIDELKNAYSLEFLSLPGDHNEDDLHAALLRNLGRFITELGRDFCFGGSEYPVQVGKRPACTRGNRRRRASEPDGRFVVGAVRATFVKMIGVETIQQPDHIAQPNAKRSLVRVTSDQIASD